jgi:homoserine O-acetyltransferase
LGVCASASARSDVDCVKRVHTRCTRPLRACLLFLAAACNSCDGGQRLAHVGDLSTESGELIHDCQVGYRTFGRLDRARSNAVLMLPWFQGTSRELSGQIGPGQMVDSNRFFVIAVDALGNGVSSSPSNDPARPSGFPRVGIVDIVRSQHALLTRVLGINHVRAVIGVSMGGMQAFAWATEFPDFADKVVAIAGSPRATATDRQYWAAASSVVASRGAWWRAAEAVWNLEPADALRQLRTNVADFRMQAEAMRGFDLSASHGGSMKRAAAAVRARTLVVVSQRDEVVNPGPARDFARRSGAELLVLDGRCGHQATQCERQTLFHAVRQFLQEGRGTGR